MAWPRDTVGQLLDFVDLTGGQVDRLPGEIEVSAVPQVFCDDRGGDVSGSEIVVIAKELEDPVVRPTVLGRQPFGGDEETNGASELPAHLAHAHEARVQAKDVHDSSGLPLDGLKQGSQIERPRGARRKAVLVDTPPHDPARVPRQNEKVVIGWVLADA